MSTAESFIALGGIIVGFTTCFIAGTPTENFSLFLFAYIVYCRGGYYPPAQKLGYEYSPNLSETENI